ncbi:hypothetical protein D3C85_1628770 [compost metagenome]
MKNKRSVKRLGWATVFHVVMCLTFLSFAWTETKHYGFWFWFYLVVACLDGILFCYYLILLTKRARGRR